MINYVEVGIGAQRTLTYLAASGVLERFSELHVVMVECGAGWLAWVLERMDEAFEEHHWWVNPKLAAPPSDYVRRNVRVTPQWSEPLDVLVDRYGLRECYVFNTDYPHVEGGHHPIESFHEMTARVDDPIPAAEGNRVGG